MQRTTHHIKNTQLSEISPVVSKGPKQRNLVLAPLLAAPAEDALGSLISGTLAKFGDCCAVR